MIMFYEKLNAESLSMIIESIISYHLNIRKELFPI